MNETDNKKNFWKSMSGILTGIAAILTAATGLYIALHESERPKALPYPARSSVITTGNPPRVSPEASTDISGEWPRVIANETFTETSVDWFTGTSSDDIVQGDWSITGGSYRWDLFFEKRQFYSFAAPYQPVTNFYLAVTINFVDYTSTDISANLMFGRTTQTDFKLRIHLNGYYTLVKFEINKGSEVVLERTPFIEIPLTDKSKSNRFAISVSDQILKIYVNSAPRGSFELTGYKGGKVGLSVTSNSDSSVSAVIDFDDFVLRTK